MFASFEECTGYGAERLAGVLLLFEHCEKTFHEPFRILVAEVFPHEIVYLKLHRSSFICANIHAFALERLHKQCISRELQRNVHNSG
jgi:hypothetical protein